MVDDGALRFYWSRRMRVLGGILIGVAFLVFVLASIKARHWWSVLPFDAVGLVVISVSARTFWRMGVRETPHGLVGRVGRYRSDCAWGEIVGFGSASVGPQQIVVAELADGSRAVIRGARRRMNWHGGRTDDFAALLDQRRILLTPNANAARDAAH